VLIALAVFLLEHGQTDKQTNATERPTLAGGYARVGNDDERTGPYTVRNITASVARLSIITLLYNCGSTTAVRVN